MVSKKKLFESKEWLKVEHLLRNGLKLDKLPAFMFKLLFTLNLIDPILNLSLAQFTSRARGISIFTSSVISAMINFPTFQHKLIKKHRFYSLDLSLYVVVRALDTLISSIFEKYSVSTTTFDIGSFILCSFLIMYSWFYYPERLPPAFKNWITKLADMDYELIEALRMLHHSQLFYGKSSPNDKVLAPLCERVGLDLELGNPAKTHPIPCDIVHSNFTHNCEVHALIRFLRGFKFASTIYVPLNAILMITSILKKKAPLHRIILRAIVSLARSSTFLAMFITLNWYPICFTRNKLGPWLYSKFPKHIDPNFDKALLPTLGCLCSGFSSIIETAKRRRDLTLFCAPKALLTLIPLEPSLRNLNTETIGFSVFFAIMVVYAKVAPGKIRGIYGRWLSYLLSA